MKEEVEDFIKSYVDSYKFRTQVYIDWNEPLVAFAGASDPMFRKLKEMVDPDHFMPSDMLADATTVISYFIPFTEKTVLSNIKCKGASKQWAQAYVETNQLINNLNAALFTLLKKRGYKAFATSPTRNFDKEKLVSLWSQKHVAYVAGLGKFGLHHMIITEKGCCGRLGSIVTNAKIEPTQRNAAEFCLYKINGSCGVCVEKCKLKALKFGTLDKRACYNECLRNAKKYGELGLADVCGKCAVNVPCSFLNPSKTQKKLEEG